ncbi:hypothetical protein D3C78_1030480 [compost metagenome]
MQVDIDAFAGIERNLEHGIQRLLHCPVDIGRIQPANVLHSHLHGFAHQTVDFGMQQPVLREGDDFTAEVCPVIFQRALQVFQAFQPADRIDIAVAAGYGAAFRLQQGDQVFRTLLRGGQQLGDQGLFERDHVHDGFALTWARCLPWAAVKGFIQMDMHVAKRRQQQLALRLIARYPGGRRCFFRVNCGNFSVFDFKLVQRGAGADHRLAIVLKTVFQSNAAQPVVAVGQGHGCALWYTCAARWRGGLRHAPRQTNDCAGGGELAGLAEESSAALLLVFFHVQFLNPEVRCVKRQPPI